MTQSFRFVPHVVIALSIAGATRVAAQATGETTPLDNLEHPPGTVTGAVGIAHIERRGKGPVPIVLIAGAPFGWHAWESFMARNEALYTMFAVTPAGYDGTPPPAMPDAEHANYAERAWTRPLIEDIVTLIEKEIAAPGKLGPAIVIGHHLMGDYYALRVAREHPELVRAVVLAAGMGSFPVGQGAADASTRGRFVREDRAPYFKSVSRATWNANTFPATSLSRDAVRGKRLYEAQIGVPIATQLRYYLEYMTDELEGDMEAIRVPVLVMTLEPPAWTFDNLSDSMKDQLLKKFGSLEEARKQVQFGGPMDVLISRAKPEQVRLEEIPNAGIFLMDDNGEAFDRCLGDFVVALPEAPRVGAGVEEQE